MSNEEDILKGTYAKALLEHSKYEAQIKDIIKLSVENIYQSKEVIDKEIAGFKVINELLNIFTTAISNNFTGKTSSFDKLILKVFPKNINIKQDTLYENLLSVCFYISKLSDRNAILTFNKLKGNHL